MTDAELIAAARKEAAETKAAAGDCRADWTEHFERYAADFQKRITADGIAACEERALLLGSLADRLETALAEIARLRKQLPPGPPNPPRPEYRREFA